MCGGGGGGRGVPDALSVPGNQECADWQYCGGREGGGGARCYEFDTERAQESGVC